MGASLLVTVVADCARGRGVFFMGLQPTKDNLGKGEAGSSVDRLASAMAALLRHPGPGRVLTPDEGRAAHKQALRCFEGVSKGTLGVWGWDSYFANFKYTPAS